MITIENRSAFFVTVRKHRNLDRTFAYHRKKEFEAYVAELKTSKYEPVLSRGDSNYAVRVRALGHRTQCIKAKTYQEAIDIKDQIDLEHRKGLFIDYGKGRSVTFGDLLTRYLCEVSPRHKGFEVEGYIINAILVDAGLPRVDIAKAYADHKNRHPSLAKMKFRKPTGRRMRTPSLASCFIRKPFADIMPEDFNDYIDDRCQSVSPSTVDREIDVFSAVCRMAIDTWRVPVAKSPMDGILRPKYFNERDRRLKDGEETRLLNAAYDEDAQKSIERRLEELMRDARAASIDSATVYRRKIIVKAGRSQYLSEAEASYVHLPWMETFIQFQLMTGARRSETMSLTWANIDFVQNTAFIPETKNGRPRTIPLRKSIVALLERLPRSGETVFPITLDSLRKAWARICLSAELVDNDDLLVHDLRHEAISRVADAGGRLPGGFTLLDLQAFSGHRDTRMLLRYTHLCMPALAKRLDEAFKDERQVVVHRGQRRLKKGAQLTMKVLTNPPSATANESSAERVFEPAASNVVPFRRRVAASETRQ